MVDAALETERLILRPPLADDLGWQQTHLNTAAVMAYMGGVRGADAVAAGFDRNAEAFEAGEPGFFTVMMRDGGAIAGKCGLARIAGCEPAQMQGGVQVGWSLAEGFWGQGLAAEAARTVIEWGFSHFALQTIWSQTSDSNLASTRLMRRLGLTRRGELDYVDPDYPPADNPTTVYCADSAHWIRQPGP